jgi:hypothetical protein
MLRLRFSAEQRSPKAQLRQSRGTEEHDTGR